MEELELGVFAVLPVHLEHPDHLPARNKRKCQPKKNEQAMGNRARVTCRSTSAPLSGRAMTSSTIPCHLLQAAWTHVK